MTDTLSTDQEQVVRAQETIKRLTTTIRAVQVVMEALYGYAEKLTAVENGEYEVHKAEAYHNAAEAIRFALSDEVDTKDRKVPKYD
jgi:hypothetical protein